MVRTYPVWPERDLLLFACARGILRWRCSEHVAIECPFDLTCLSGDCRRRASGVENRRGKLADFGVREGKRSWVESVAPFSGRREGVIYSPGLFGVPSEDGRPARNVIGVVKWPTVNGDRAMWTRFYWNV